MRLLKYFSIIVIVAAIGIYIRKGQPQYQSFRGSIFGTFYQIKIRTSQKDNALHDKIKAELAKINAEMSVFDEKSEVSTINKSQAGIPITLSDNMSYLLRYAHKIYTQTAGAFDPTVGPVVDLWGFGPTQAQAEPSSSEITKAKKTVGFDKLLFDEQFKTATKQNSQTSLNLSAIAKGYGVDRVAELLEKLGYKNYIIEIGGEVRLAGHKDNSGTAWVIGVREPKMDGANVIAMELSNTAVATSGDYQNFRQSATGQTYSHIIHPKTGRPAETNLASVTVFADLCLEADAYATAMMTMNLDEATAFADLHKLKVIFFTHGEGGSFHKSYSLAAKEQLGE